MDPKTLARILVQYPQIFEAATSRLLNSPNRSEQESLFMGIARDGEHPITCPRQTAFSHCHILGDSGSGKTARGLMPLLAQVIGAANSSVFVGDLKGDLALFNFVREEAARAGLPFKFFTNRSGWASYAWNPISEPFFQSRLSAPERAQCLLTGFGCDHGEIYGGSFYTGTMKMFSSLITERFREQLQSAADYYRYCADSSAYKGLGPAADWENSRHLIAQLYVASQIGVFNTTAQNAVSEEVWRNRISVEELLTTPTVVYFFMQSTVDASTITSLVRLFLHSLVVAAAIYRPEGKSCDVFAFIDEAQQIATHGLPLILNQARSNNIACILAHQSLDQLKSNSEMDLTQIVLSATAIKQVFRSSDQLSRKYLNDTAGEAMQHVLSWRQTINRRHAELNLRPSVALIDNVSGRPVINVQEQIRPRLEPNTIMEISAGEGLSLLNITENRGPASYDAAWIPTVSGYIMSEAEYQRLKNTPWPGPGGGAAIASPRPHGPLGGNSTSAASAENAEFNRRIQDGLRRLRPNDDTSHESN